MSIHAALEPVLKHHVGRDDEVYLSRFDVWESLRLSWELVLEATSELL
jgi:hypothetical protein